MTTIFQDILPCLLNITTLYANSTVFLFISEEIRELPSHEIIFQNLKGTVEVRSYDNFAEKQGFFILFPQNNKSYKKILSQIQPDMYNR